MNRKTLGLVGIGLLAILVILLVTLPVSGAGKTGPQDGTGNQFGLSNQNGQDQAGYGPGSGNGTCIREDCPNNGVRPLDGTGMHHHAGTRSGNGGQSGSHGHGMGHHS